MVSFQCDSCLDTVKKPKLDAHHGRCHASFTCIDCSTTFNGPRDWKGHTQCISEAEKYQKALYKGPKGAAKDGRQNQKKGPENAPVTPAAPAPVVALASNDEPQATSLPHEEASNVGDAALPSVQKKEKRKKKAKAEQANEDGVPSILTSAAALATSATNDLTTAVDSAAANTTKKSKKNKKKATPIDVPTATNETVLPLDADAVADNDEITPAPSAPAESEKKKKKKNKAKNSGAPVTETAPAPAPAPVVVSAAAEIMDAAHDVNTDAPVAPEQGKKKRKKEKDVPVSAPAAATPAEELPKKKKRKLAAGAPISAAEDVGVLPQAPDGMDVDVESKPAPAKLNGEKKKRRKKTSADAAA